jgi:hypothetical protein
MIMPLILYQLVSLRMTPCRFTSARSALISEEALNIGVDHGDRLPRPEAPHRQIAVAAGADRVRGTPARRLPAA